MQQLKIKRFELEAAFETNSPEILHYLDRQSGDVLAVADEPAGELDKGDALDWQKQAFAVAARVAANPAQFLRVPPTEAGESHADLVAFTETVADAQLRTQLQRALHGRGAFGRFRGVLHGAFREQQRWYAYR